MAASWSPLENARSKASRAAFDGPARRALTSSVVAPVTAYILVLAPPPAGIPRRACPHTRFEV
jgi:hypothetical protein